MKAVSVELKNEENEIRKKFGWISERIRTKSSTFAPEFQKT
jgi:hypothetical protein